MRKDGGVPRGVLPALLVLIGLSGCGAAPAGAPLSLPPSSRLPASRSSHIIEIVMENAEYGEVIGNPEAPYVNSLARRYGLARGSYAITHPSLPNYLALTGGTTAGITSDCSSCSDPNTSIADQLEAAGISWKAYLEGLPRPCFGGAAAGAYAKKHDPFAYYPRLISDPARCNRIVGFGRLAKDLRTGGLPSYAWISPNLCDDGHDCRLRTADGFLARTVPPLLHELGPQGFLVLTWDEGTTDSGCCGVADGGHIATIVAGPQVRRGATSTAALDHYGVLASIERALGLAPLAGAADSRAGSLDDLFSTTPSLR
jgi:phosphatidylinositol-3-phosphatase